MKVLRRFGLKKGLILVALLVVLASAIGANAYESKSIRENGVRVDVRPVSINIGEPVKFEVRLNTHSVDLSYDMAAISMLTDDTGRNYRPIRWDGSPPGGHHRRGVLEFPALEGNPTLVTLMIRDIAGVHERVFEWDLRQ